MSTNEIWNVSFAILTSLGGASVIVWGLSSWLGKVWASRILNNEKAKLNKELQKFKQAHKTELETYKTELEKARNDYNRYSSKKFQIIEETWNAMFTITDELNAISFYENKYNEFLEQNISIILKYLQLIKKNSLYFNQDIEQLLNEFININSEIVAYAGEKAKENNPKEYTTIFREVQAKGIKREKKLEEIKIKFKRELNFD